MDIKELDDLLMDRLECLYGSEVPDEIAERCVKERNYLKKSVFQREFGAYIELLMDMKKNNMEHSVIGKASHSYFLYLLLQLEMNPLPPHYYCPVCKDAVFIDCEEEMVMGIDLPRMRCRCGCVLKRNGFNLSEEMFWKVQPVDLGFCISEENYEYVKKYLCDDDRLKDEEIREEEINDVDVAKIYKIGAISIFVKRNKKKTVLGSESNEYGSHVFVECMPSPEQCLMPNEIDYLNDERTIKLREELNDTTTRICIIGGNDEEITRLYEEMVLKSNQIDDEYLQEAESISITIFKRIFWFRDEMSYKIFEDVYSHEKNELITRYYDRTFESVSGNNLCISLNDAWGMIDRLPFDMWSVANRSTKGRR